MPKNEIYNEALNLALIYMEMEDGYLSSLKQAASDKGIAYGDEMAAFVKWAEIEIGISSERSAA